MSAHAIQAFGRGPLNCGPNNCKFSQEGDYDAIAFSVKEDLPFTSLESPVDQLMEFSVFILG